MGKHQLPNRLGLMTLNVIIGEILSIMCKSLDTSEPVVCACVAYVRMHIRRYRAGSISLMQFAHIRISAQDRSLPCTFYCSHGV